MAQKLKKSKTKPKSKRAIEMEEKTQAAIAAHENEIRKQKRKNRDMVTIIFCWYSLVASVFSVVLGFWGIFSIMAIGFGIAGISRLKKEEEDNGKMVKRLEFWACVAGITVGAVWLGVQIYYAYIRYAAGSAN